MKVLIVGNGSREHALGWALYNDPAVAEVNGAPGTAMMAHFAELYQVDQMDGESIAALAKELDSDLVVIGPEAPLVVGVADAVREAGIPVFGPSAQAAQIEGSKAFAKEIMEAAGVPTAAARICETPEEVEAALDEFGAPYVVKEDGLAAGKGVLVTSDRDAAIDHAEKCRRVLIEEYLDGPEVSLFAICDGKTSLPMLPAQDFKRAFDGGEGPNTGGMGAYAPLPWAPDDLAEQINEHVIKPVIAEMARRGTPFVGLLYAGLSLTSKGAKVIEFNARFGDPETQPLMLLLETPLGGLLMAAAKGELADHPPLKWHPGYAVGVVMAADGYPSSPKLGGRMHEGQFRSGNIKLFHAGTMRDELGNIRISGGRVFTVTGRGHTLGFARSMVYAAIKSFHVPGLFWRSDIAEKAATNQIDFKVPEGGMFP